MPMLNTSKLYGRVNGRWVLGTPTRTTSKGEEYRCPVCATGDGDEKGQHLIVFKDRANYACAAYPKDEAHRFRIMEMVGIRGKGKPDPVIPRKIHQKATFIGRHVMNMEKEAEEVRRRDADFIAARREKERLHREAIERWIASTENERETRKTIPNTQTQHIDTKCNKEQFGTFGTGISCSANMPPPPIKEATTVSNGRGYAVPICEKASQTSQVRSWRKAAGPEDCNKNEEYSSDFGLAFNRNNPKWREHYYLWYRSKYYGEAVAF